MGEASKDARGKVCPLLLAASTVAYPLGLTAGMQGKPGVGCIGVDCMLWRAASVEVPGQARGKCGLAGPALQHPVN